MVRYKCNNCGRIFTKYKGGILDSTPNCPNCGSSYITELGPDNESSWNRWNPAPPIMCFKGPRFGCWAEAMRYGG